VGRVHPAVTLRVGDREEECPHLLLGGDAYFSVAADMVALTAFTLSFMVAAHLFHSRSRDRVA
jgi:hypothetical protein